MKRDEIIRLARESTLMVDFQNNGLPYFPALERFAELVAAAERERIVDILRDDGWIYCATMIERRKS
jgi:hypothetical protein